MKAYGSVFLLVLPTDFKEKWKKSEWDRYFHGEIEQGFSTNKEKWKGNREISISFHSCRKMFCEADMDIVKEKWKSQKDMVDVQEEMDEAFLHQHQQMESKWRHMCNNFLI